ncbi:hypothetical protein AB0M28_05385 [Streptomyces sp. NPDC051940]|uniref:hypothetical protein n=1 Tax=Streptomyces sp. NPDC051940 TaxID=3155675 RepID=UPI0034229DA1
MTVNHVNWRWYASDYTPGAGSHGTGLAVGFLNNISVHVTIESIIGTCEFDLSGAVDADYDNPTAGGSNGTLVLSAGGSGNQLAVSNKTGSGCAVVSDTFELSGTYSVLVGTVSPVITGT